jgi:hypothetical protein
MKDFKISFELSPKDKCVYLSVDGPDLFREDAMRIVMTKLTPRRAAEVLEELCGFEEVQDLFMDFKNPNLPAHLIVQYEKPVQQTPPSAPAAAFDLLKIPRPA